MSPMLCMCLAYVLIAVTICFVGSLSTLVYMSVLFRCPVPSEMYCVVFSTTMPAPLSACLIEGARVSLPNRKRGNIQF